MMNMLRKRVKNSIKTKIKLMNQKFKYKKLIMKKRRS